MKKKLLRIKLVLALLAGLLVADIGPVAQPAQAANGTCETNGTVAEGDSGNYHWVKFTVTTNSSGDATCTFRTPAGVSIVSVLSVSGGGGGGHDGGGGGGGGGVLYYDQMQLNENTDYRVIVGAGGAAAGSSCTSGNCPEGIDGNLSKFNNNYAAGGGGGGGRYSAGNSAGTGGGAGHTNDATVLSGGTGSGYSDGFSVTYGRNGGNNASTRGGGGAGAVAAGNNGGDLDAGVGGKGFTSSIDGTSRVYGGGGGGGTYTGNAQSIVNVGGGGIGGNNTNNGANGSDGFGGGGGGGGDSDNPAGRGGSGVVIVRYLTVDTCATPTPVTDGSEVYLKFVTTSESRSCLKSWTVPTGVSSVQLLVIGGGGSGGTRRGTLGGGGGGGAGGFRSESSFSVTPGNSISILVGGGGAAQTAQQDAWGFDGNLSYFSTVIAQGGGGGGAYCGGADDQTDTRSNAVTISINGRAGGSGGGGGRCSSSTGGAAANASYGNAGGSANATAVAGGGGGKGSAGNSGGAASNPGRGGNGATSTITGSTLTYAAGGGGSGGVAALGGSSIGGTGAREGVSAATAGSSQTGSGGGGGYASSGAGGSGVVIVRYQPSTCSPTSTNSNGFEYVSFTTVTTCNWQIPTGVSSIDLVVVGGGGGGGYDSGGGGGGGGYAEKIGLSVTSGATFILTVGSGGAAATSSQSVGTTGSSSIFSSISATGGTGGGSCTYTGQGFNGSSCESRNIGGNRGTGTNGTTNSTSTKVGGNGFCFSNSGSGCSSAVSASASGWTSSVNSQTYSIGGGGGGSADVNPTANTGSGGKGGGGNSTGSAGASGFIVVKYRSGPLNVTFDSQGGSAVASTTVLTGETLPAPTAPTRAGYNFFGWATASYGTPITFPYTHNQSANFTLYAQWGAKSLTIVYDTQGGSSIPNGSVLVGSFINPAPATPTRDGYTFNGWFVAPTGGTAISNFSTYTHNQTSNFTLYAQWSVTAPNLSSVTVSGTALSGSIITATPSATGLGPITFNYQWYRILTGLGTFLIDGATSSTYTLTDSDLLGYAYVNVTASNEGGSSSSVIGSMPANQKIGVATPTISGNLQSGQLLTGSTTSTIPAGATFEYRWLSSDTAGGTYTEIDKATNSTYRLTSSDIGKYIKFRIIIRNNNLGVTSIASSSNATNVVAVSEPTISSQPTSATKYAGQSATFSVTASASDSGSLSYQWKKNAIDIKDATSSSYVINSVTSGDAGSYTVVVTNTLNGTTATATSNAAVLTFATATQLSTPNTPGTTTITGSTTSIGVTYTAVTNATSHTVKVYASGVLVGTARTSFVSGTTITGLTAGTTYTVTVTALGDGTFYTDSTESAASTITTNAAAVIPTINSQPTSATRYAGQSVDFTVVASASDSGSLSYQWKKNGTVISGAQSATLSINPISSSDAGDYTVDITNTKNGTTASITSNTATLTFATATQLSTPTAPTVSATSGSTTSITVSFTSVANASSHTVKVYASNVLVGTAHTSFSSGSTITGLSPNTAYTVTVTAIGDGTIYSDSAASTSASVTTNEFLGSALTPEIDGVESTLDGFRMSLKNYDSNFNFTFSLTNGALASINSSGIISVTNLAPGESSTITITTSRTNYPSASVSTSGTAISIKTVTFNANGGLGTMTAQTGRTSGTLSANTFTRQYYDFLRWNTESNGTGNDYEDLATYSFIGDLTLYALWSPIPLTVTYNSQGGTPVSNGATTYLGKISSAPTPPTRSGYTFLGWSATPAGSVVLFEYTHNQNSNFTLYAIWRLNVAVPTISSQPVSANKYSGQSVTFSVTASVSDSGVLSYQWKKNGTNISGATASSYAINSVSSSDAGDYTVVITNTNNGETSSITSDVAKLNFVASTQLATPSAPTVTATSGSTTSITISFTAISNASSYTARIYQGGSQVGAARTSFTSGSTITGLTAGTTYTVTITAIGDGSIYSDSAASSAATVITNSPATNTNTITFATISNKTYGDSFSVTVSASSGLTVTVSSSTTSVCTVSTLTVTAISVGTCTLVAAQGGDGTYPSATSVTNTFTVGKKSLVITASDQSGTVGSSTSAPSYSQSGLVTALGDAIGSVSYTYAGSGSTRYAPSSNAPASGGNWILGTYKITPSSLVLSSGSASNYNISYVQGTLTVSGTSTTGISAISVKSTGLNRTTELLTGFSPSTTSYGIYVESAVTSVTVVITRSAGSLANAQVSVNDSGFRRLTFTSNAANSGILALPQQSNTITLKIVATDLSVQTYTISILRDQATSSATGGVPTPTPTATPRPANRVINSVAFFVNSASGNTSSLIEVSMNRAFDKAVSSYTVSFTNAQSVTQLRTTFTDPGITIRIKVNQGAFRTIPSTGASTSLALNVGANTAILRVASSDGTVTDYTFTLNRAA